MDKVIATVGQIRRALALVKPVEGTKAHPKAYGWALLDILRADGVKLTPKRIVEDALDWEATFTVQEYARTSVEFRKTHPGKRIAKHVRFSRHGVER